MSGETGQLQRLADEQVKARLAAYNRNGSLDRDMRLFKDHLLAMVVAEIREQWPEELNAWLADPDVAPPGGESFTATFARVGGWRQRLVAAHPGQTVVVVSHVTPIKALLREALDAPAHVLYRIHLDPASVSTVDWYSGGAGVVRLVNDPTHLDLA